MDANEPTDLSVSEASRRIADGALTPSALLEACLQRIAATDDAVHAWVSVDESGARATARERTDEARAGRRRGPLHGIPVAIKDIFPVAA
jgi:aspartyl-tRNA(Asn)/glutamyl-tRNA(Gln) amidotransferase subunit A